MKKYLFITLVILICSTGTQAQNFLYDNSGMLPWTPVVPTYTEYQTIRSNGDKFNGQQERTNGNVTGYRGTLTKRDGSYYYGLFDAYFRPIRGGWYVKNNTLYYNIYENGVAVNSERVETGGRRFYFLDQGRNSLRFYEDSYSSSDYNYNSGSSNSSSKSGSSYKPKTAHPSKCTNCVGRGICSRCSGSGRVLINMRSGKYIPCSSCNHTGKCRTCNGTGYHGHTWY